MVNKNVNLGDVNSAGGDVQIGDNYITYQIEGLSELLNEYKDQLEIIEKLIHEFKPRTALGLLEELEGRIKDKGVKNKKIFSKLVFLKASCKRELNDFSVDITAKEFIQSYRLNEDDEKLKATACIEYVNLNDDEKAVLLANEILKTDEYNLTAWYAKLLCSNDLKESLKKVPENVRKNYGFQHTLIYYIIKTHTLNYIEELHDYGFSINIDLDKYKKLTFENKQGWIISIDLLINKIFNDYPVRYISGDNYVFLNNPQIDDVLTILGRFIQPLEDSEIKDSINHQKFFLHYFNYFKNKKTSDLEQLKETYDKLPNNHWFYTLTLCQAYNNGKKFEKSLEAISEYENKGGDKISEMFLFKATTLVLDKKISNITEVFDDYLSSVQVIDERVGFNILNAFFNVFRRELTIEDFKSQIEKVKSKKFANDDLKELYDITCNIRYFEPEKEKDEELYSRLLPLLNSDKLDRNYKNLIAENLDNLDKNQEAIDFLSKYIDKSVVSNELRFYIHLLHKQLQTNKESGRGIYKELLQLLKFYRENSDYSDEELLGFEHNLNLEKNDWEELKRIDYQLYNSFPASEKYLLFYLIALEKLELIEEIKSISDSIQEDFKDETIGVQISKLLLRNKVNTEKGSRIMFNLASNSFNTQARKFYLGISHLFGEDFFKKFEEVKKGVWVRYSINLEKIDEVKVLKDTGFQKELIGKKVGDKFTVETQLTGVLNTIEILGIFNDELKLNYEIQKEVQNPVNELGFSSMEIPTDIEEFEKFLVEQFGTSGSQEKAFKEKTLNDYYNYRIGFTEVVRSVFRDSPIDGYFHLVKSNDTKFTTIPSLITKPIDNNQENKFALDFSSLLLFYELDKDFDFKFEDKFVVSYFLKEWVKLELIEEKNSPESKITVQITEEGIRRHLIPEDYKSKRIQHFESILDWIEKNCVVDLVEEKLDISMSLDKRGGKDGATLKLLIDNMHLSMRQDHRLISSDSSLFMFQHQRGLFHNILNPEKYLVYNFPDKCDTEFYRYLLKDNYLGININSGTLRNEFYAMLVGSENYYQKCLDNMQFSINNNPNIINLATKFLKEVYLINSLLKEQKNRYAFEIFRNTFYGMTRTLIDSYERLLKKEFTLLGDSYDEVLRTFKEVRLLYRI